MAIAVLERIKEAARTGTLGGIEEIGISLLAFLIIAGLPFVLDALQTLLSRLSNETALATVFDWIAAAVYWSLVWVCMASGFITGVFLIHKVRISDRPLYAKVFFYVVGAILYAESLFVLGLFFHNI